MLVLQDQNIIEPKYIQIAPCYSVWGNQGGVMLHVWDSSLNIIDSMSVRTILMSAYCYIQENCL